MMPDANGRACRSIARCVLPVLVGPSTALTREGKPSMASMLGLPGRCELQAINPAGRTSELCMRRSCMARSHGRFILPNGNPVPKPSRPCPPALTVCVWSQQIGRRMGLADFSPRTRTAWPTPRRRLCTIHGGRASWRSRGVRRAWTRAQAAFLRAVRVRRPRHGQILLLIPAASGGVERPDCSPGAWPRAPTARPTPTRPCRLALPEGTRPGGSRPATTIEADALARLVPRQPTGSARLSKRAVAPPHCWLVPPQGGDAAIALMARATCFARDLINTPANLLGPGLTLPRRRWLWPTGSERRPRCWTVNCPRRRPIRLVAAVGAGSDRPPVPSSGFGVVRPRCAGRVRCAASVSLCGKGRRVRFGRVRSQAEPPACCA